MSMTEIMNVMRMILGSLLPSVFGQKAGLEMTVMSEARIGEAADQLYHTDLVLIQQELRTLSHVVITNEWTGEHPKRTDMTHGLEAQMKVDRLIKASATLETYANGCECIECKFVVAKEMPSLKNVVLGTPVSSFTWTGTGMVEEAITPDPALELDVPITEDEIRYHMKKWNGVIRSTFVWQHKMNAAELIEDLRKASYPAAGYEPTYVGGGSDAEHDWVEANYNFDSEYDREKNRMNASMVVVNEARTANGYNLDRDRTIHDVQPVVKSMKEVEGWTQEMLYIIIRDSTNASDRVEAAEMLVELKQKQLHSYLKDNLKPSVFRAVDFVIGCMPSDLDLNTTVVQESRVNDEELRGFQDYRMGATHQATDGLYYETPLDECLWQILDREDVEANCGLEEGEITEAAWKQFLALHKDAFASAVCALASEYYNDYHTPKDDLSDTVVQESRTRMSYMFKEGDEYPVSVANKSQAHKMLVHMIAHASGDGTPIAIVVANTYADEAFDIPMETPHSGDELLHGTYQAVKEVRDGQSVHVQLSRDDERFDHTTVKTSHVWDRRTLTNSDINRLREQWNRELDGLDSDSRFFPYSITGARAASSLIGQLLTKAEDDDYGGSVMVNVLCAEYKAEQVLRVYNLKDEFGDQIMSQAAGYNLPMTDVSLLEMSHSVPLIGYREAKNTFISLDGGRWSLSWAITGSYDDMTNESPRIEISNHYVIDKSIRDLCDHILTRKDSGRLLTTGQVKSDVLVKATSKENTYLVSDHQLKIVKKDLADLRSAAQLSLDDTVVHEVRLDIPDEHWDTLMETLLLDTETMAIEPSERDRIREALDSVETVNPFFDRGQLHCGFDVLKNPLYRISLADAINVCKAGGLVWLANESQDNYGGEDSRHYSYPVENHEDLYDYEDSEELLIVLEPMFYNKHGNLLEGHILPNSKDGVWKVSLTLARDARHRLADETHFDEEHIEGEIKSWLEDIDYRVLECDIIDVSNIPNANDGVYDLGDAVKNQLMAVETEEEVKEIAILYQTRQAWLDGFRHKNEEGEYELLEPSTKEQIDALYVPLPNSVVLDVIEQLQPVWGYHWSKVVGNLDTVSDQIFHIMNHDNRNPLSVSFHKHGIDGDRTMQNWMGDNGLGHTSMSMNDVIAYRLTDGWVYHSCRALGWAWLPVIHQAQGAENMTRFEKVKAMINLDTNRIPLQEGELELIEAMVNGFNHPRINDSWGELNEDGMFWATKAMETLSHEVIE